MPGSKFAQKLNRPKPPAVCHPPPPAPEIPPPPPSVRSFRTWIDWTRRQDYPFGKTPPAAETRASGPALTASIYTLKISDIFILRWTASTIYAGKSDKAPTRPYLEASIGINPVTGNYSLNLYLWLVGVYLPDYQYFPDQTPVNPSPLETGLILRTYGPWGSHIKARVSQKPH